MTAPDDVRGTANRGVGGPQPSMLEDLRQQVVLGAILGLRQGFAVFNPLGPGAVIRDRDLSNQLQMHGNYERAFEAATGLQDYFDIKREGESVRSARGEQLAVMLGHATGFNQAVETIKAEDRSGNELRGIDRFARGVDAAARLGGTVTTVATGVQGVSSTLSRQAQIGLPFSAQRAMNKALIADRAVPFAVQPPTSPIGFHTPYAEMAVAEQRAFQHAYNQLSHRLPGRLPAWNKRNVEQNREVFNAVVNLIRNNAKEVRIVVRNIAEKGSGLPAERRMVAMYVAEIEGRQYYIYSTPEGRFVSAGELKFEKE